MSVALSVVAIVVSILGLQIHYWPTFLLFLGPGFLYRVQIARLLTLLVALGAASGAYLLSPTTGQGIVLAATALLSLGNGFLHPRRAIPALVDPGRSSAAVALGAEAMVVGVSLPDGSAAAYPLETLVPHHLVVDSVSGRRVLAAW